MTFDEFWAGSQMEGKTLNPTESKLACHLAWANSRVAERERCAKIAETFEMTGPRIAAEIRNQK